MLWVNALLQGILLGGLYALLAAGLSLMFGVMRIVNLAHGVLAVTAAYLGMVLVQAGVNVWVAIPIVVVLMAALGYVLQRLLFNRAIAMGEKATAMGEMAPLLVAFGLSVVLTQVLQEVFSADTQSLSIGELGTASIQLGGGLAIGTFALLTFVVGVVAVVAIQLFLARTPLGRAMRAASDDPTAVQMMGISHRQVYALATALALGTVGLAGMFLGMRTQFSPTFGAIMLIFAFEAVIIGGLGSLWGTLAGGIVLGVAQTVGAQINPAWGVLAGHVVFLAILAVKPTGLISKGAGS